MTYSPFMAGIKEQFEANAAAGQLSAMLVYWHGWGDYAATRTVKSGQWPWAVHDDYASRNTDAILALALDLRKAFDAQIPEHMREFEKLEAFAYRPMIHIPDREGKTSEARGEADIKRLLSPRPALRIVR